MVRPTSADGYFLSASEEVSNHDGHTYRQRRSRMCRAIEEIEKLIIGRYLSTTLAVTQSADPHGIRVLTTVDVDDLDEGLDLYFHRLAQLHVEEGLLLSVIPMQTPARLAGCSPSTPSGRSVSA